MMSIVFLLSLSISIYGNPLRNDALPHIARAPVHAAATTASFANRPGTEKNTAKTLRLLRRSIDIPDYED